MVQTTKIKDSISD